LILRSERQAGTDDHEKSRQDVETLHGGSSRAECITNPRETEITEETDLHGEMDSHGETE
jgi:hypothetical protein